MSHSDSPTPIKVFDIVGKNATMSSDGKILYDAAYFLVKAGRTVEFNFKKVDIVTINFLNCSLGHLLKDCDRSQIVATNLTSFQEDLLKKVLDNAEVYYGKAG